MATIADYNDLYSAIAETTDNKPGAFNYQEQNADEPIKTMEEVRRRATEALTKII